MWELDNPWWEYTLRSLVIYAAVYVLLRVIGKKQIGEMSPFDLVLLLIISEAVSAAITGGDNSIGAGLIAVTTFVLANYFLDVLIFKSRTIEKIMEGEPELIIVDGKTIKKVQEKEKITDDEIKSVLREHGLDDLKQVAYAVLENNGQITIIKKDRQQSTVHRPHQDAGIP